MKFISGPKDVRTGSERFVLETLVRSHVCVHTILCMKYRSKLESFNMYNHTK